MNKLVCETKKARVTSFKLVCDPKVDLTSSQYSIEEIGKVNDKSYLDAEGKSSPNEILLNFESEKDINTANIPVFLKKQVEEFDRFKLKIFFNDNLTNTWAFSWPDRSEDGIFELPLREVLEELDIPEPENGPVDLPKPPGSADPPKPPGPPDPPKPPGPPDDPTKPPGPADPEAKKKNRALLTFLCVLLVCSGIGAFWFYKYFVPNKEYACFDTNILKKASIDNETAKIHNSNCFKRFLALSEIDFKTQLLNWTEEDTSLIIEAGDFHNPGNLTSFLKQLRPSDKPDALLASWYYAKAYDLDIEEAAGKLKDLCQNTEDLFDRTMIETDCGLIANE